MKANPQLNLVTRNYVSLIDPDDGHMSITNDAEAVCLWAHSRWPGKRIIYKDTDGTWGELLRDKANFIGFGEYTGWTPDDN